LYSGKYGYFVVHLTMLSVAQDYIALNDMMISETSGSHGDKYEDEDEKITMMDAVSTSEMSVNFYQTTRRNIPEDNLLDMMIC
jgi:hypothetical protein